MSELAHQLVDSLMIANRLSRYLLDACTDEALALVPAKGWRDGPNRPRHWLPH
jgi:hypothetical protein